MARGNSTRRNIAASEISELIRGNPAALQKQAQKGGNAPGAQSPATPQPAATNPATPAKKPSAAEPPPIPKGAEAGKPWWEQQNNGSLVRAIMGSGHGVGNIEEAAIDYGAQQEMQELINKTRKRLGLKPGQALPLPQGASVPSGVSVTGGK